MRWIIATTLAVAATPASAEVVSSSANGFHVRHTVQMVVPPPQAFDAFTKIPGWWNSEHTYSGDAANLSLVLAVGGCFCERLPKAGGGIEHMRVSYLEPGVRLVLTGSLGPLLYEATTGAMDVKVERVAGGSKVVIDYKVAGFASGTGQAMAPLVDSVLAEQFKRYRAYAAARPRA